MVVTPQKNALVALTAILKVVPEAWQVALPGLPVAVAALHGGPSTDLGLQLNAAGLLGAITGASAEGAAAVLQHGGAGALLYALNIPGGREGGAAAESSGCERSLTASDAPLAPAALQEAVAESMCALAAEASGRQALADEVYLHVP